MNRQHTIQEYFKLIDSIREILPDCGISHDMIAGFPTETTEDHLNTLKLMVKFLIPKFQREVFLKSGPIIKVK